MAKGWLRVESNGDYVYSNEAVRKMASVAKEAPHLFDVHPDLLPQIKIAAANGSELRITITKKRAASELH